MNCPNCGKEIKDNNKFCPECGSKINKKNNKQEVQAIAETNTSEKQFVKNMPNDKFLCIISLICMYGAGIVSLLLTWIGKMVPMIDGLTSILSGICGLGPIAAWVLVIYTKVHYKESNFAKILLIVYIVQVILSIIGFIILIIACIGVANQFGSDCNSFLEGLGQMGIIINLLW